MKVGRVKTRGRGRYNFLRSLEPLKLTLDLVPVSCE